MSLKGLYLITYDTADFKSNPHLESTKKNWVAVKELKLSCHSGYI